MPLYCGHEVRSKEEVDRITAQRISGVFGSRDEEMKFHREAMLGLYLTINPNAFGGSRSKEFAAIGDRLLNANKKIEDVIREGKEFKKSQGWF